MSNLSELLSDVIERESGYKTMPGRFLPEPKGTPVPTTFRLDPDQLRELKLCILAGDALDEDGGLTFLHCWNIARAMLAHEPKMTEVEPLNDSGISREAEELNLRAEIDRLSLMLLEKDQRIAELEKQVPKVRLKMRIGNWPGCTPGYYAFNREQSDCRLSEFLPSKSDVLKWCSDRGFEVVG